MAEDILIHRIEQQERQIEELRQHQEILRAVHQEIVRFHQSLLRWTIGGIAAIALSLFGSAGLQSWQNAKLVESVRNEVKYEIDGLRNEMRSEIKRLDARFDDMNQRFDDMNRRFEDLRQVVLARRP